MKVRVQRFARVFAGPIALAAPLLWLGFSAGGFFAGTTGLAAVIMGVAALVWLTVARRPFAGLTGPLALLLAALAALAAWTLLSASWSDAAARAVYEFDRTLLYLFAAFAFGLALRADGDRRRLLWGLAAAGTILCAAGLATHLLPETFSAERSVQADRLSHPVTYWNTLGLLASFTLVALLHLASSEREGVVARVLAAAAFPMVATTLFFTFSRGSIALGALALVAYVVLGRPRALAGGLIAIVPPTALVLVAAYGADVLATEQAASAAGAAQGEDVALVLLACVAGAIALRLAALPLDKRLTRARLVPRVGRRTALAAVGVLIVLLAIPAVALDAPGWASRQVDRFTEGDYVSSEGDRRDRLVQVGNNGRLDHWGASIDAFEREPLRGEGAGTYPLQWARDRPSDFDVQDGHGLYTEVLGELGLVGLGLVLLAMAALLVGAALRVRGPERAAGAATFAIVGLFVVHVGTDWDWEMPVVTLPAIVLGAAACAAGRPAGGRLAAPPQLARVLLGLGVLLLAVLPGLVWASQSRLDAAVRAFDRGDCGTAIDRALAANEVLAVRPEPFEVLAYCDARLGQPELSLRAMDAALRRDPESWRLHYGRAIVRAAAGKDPWPSLREARRRNPRSNLLEEAYENFAGAKDPVNWRRRAVEARLPL